jgi:hypothetical protein
MGARADTGADMIRFDRHTERHVPEAGLELVESRYVVDDLLKLITVRSPS